MGSPRDYEDQDILNSSAERHLVFMTRSAVRCWLRKSDAVMDMVEVSAAPANPPKATGAFFMRDSGGKAQFCVLFPSGAVQIIATEP